MDNNSLKVLLADDDLDFLKLFSKRLAGVGYNVVGEATNGQEAVDLYKKLRPDILLLDLNMPVKNGEEALKEIMGEFPDACVIMATSFRETESMAECINLGAANYIPKNSSKDQMKEIIEETWKKFKKKET